MPEFLLPQCQAAKVRQRFHERKAQVAGRRSAEVAMGTPHRRALPDVRLLPPLSRPHRAPVQPSARCRAIARIAPAARQLQVR